MQALKKVLYSMLESIHEYEAAVMTIDMNVAIGTKLGYPFHEISKQTQEQAQIKEDARRKMSKDSLAISDFLINLNAEEHRRRGYDKPGAATSLIRSSNSTPQQDYDREGMEHIRHSHNDQCDALRSISEPLEDAA